MSNIETRPGQPVEPRAEGAAGSARPARRRGRRMLAVAGIAGALLVAVPGAAYANSADATLQPGESICVSTTAQFFAHGHGTADPKARFRVFRDDVLIYDTGKGSLGFDRGFNGAGTYQLCAKNPAGQDGPVHVTVEITGDS